MEIIFNSPEYLWLLFIIPILIFAHFVALKGVKRRAVKFANFSAIERVTGGELLSNNLFLLMIRVFILLLFIFSVSGFVLIYTGMASNYDYVLAMDNSNSMIVEDLKPTRFDAAKTTAKGFIDKLGPDNEVGILSFSSIAMIESYLDTDSLHLKMVINNIDLSDVGGTDLGQAIVGGVNLLGDSKKGKAVVLITDGQVNVGVPLEEAVDYANVNGVIVHTIGVGTSEGSDFFGTSLVLDEESLVYIAKSTGGKYYQAETVEELEEAYGEIVDLTERKISQSMSMSFIVLALLLLLYEWILINTKYKTIP